jgi:CHASE2 domain-containing sensor protein
MSDQRQDPPVVSGPETAPLPASLPPLPRVLASPASPSADHELPRAMVQRVGRYELVRELASGGMGVVYEAIQDQPRRSVALKLMRAGLGSQGAVARFEHESQLLARLRHPGIAQVYDAGTYQHRALTIPYFAMEYIPGARPITEFADLRRLDIRERIGLMIKVCDAVQHGHEKGIIHRDLKPANILIDANGEPKVIDFGVARASDTSEQSSATQQTDASQLIGTLPYMSPEQYESDPRHLDGRSDVYSLGVVLYELLCGRLPHEVSRAKLSDAARMICQDPPPRPSRMKWELRGDVETILLKALQKDRSRRYASAAELRDDLSHALEGEPIAARGDSFGYVLNTRLKQFVMRHRIAAAIAAALIGVAVALLVGMPVIFNLTNLNSVFERFVTSHFATISDGQIMQNVRILAMSDQTDYETVAREAGLAGVTNSKNKSFRRLHGKLMEKLAQAEPRVVVFDVAFPGETEFDEDFVAGVRALGAVHANVVVVAASWRVDEKGRPAISQTIAPAVRWGGGSGQTGGDAPWRAYLVVEQEGAELMPSISLAAWAAYGHSDEIFAIQFRPENMLGVRFSRPIDPSAGFRRSLSSEFELVKASGLSSPMPSETSKGISQDAVIANLILDVPPTDILNSHTSDYAHVFKATPEELRKEFGGKVVVIGDLRPVGHDGPFPLPDGRQLHGFLGQASAIDSLIRGRTIELPKYRIWSGGIVIHDLWLISMAGAALGLLAAMLLSCRLGARYVLFVVVGCLLVLGSFFSYAKLHFLCNPAIPIAAMLVAGELMAAAERVRHRFGFHP